MAELILTEAEKAATSWLELDDAALGKAVKHAAACAVTAGSEHHALWWQGALLLMCGMVADTGMQKSVHTVVGLREKGRSLGTWRVTVEKLQG